MLFGRLHIVPTIHRAARDAFEYHDLAITSCRKRGKNKIFAHAGDEVERYGSKRRARNHILHVSQSQGPHGLVERRAGSVALEHAVHFAFSSSHQHQVVSLAIAVNILRTGFLDDEISAAFGKLFQPPGKLQPLIDRLSIMIEPGFPKKRTCLVGSRNCESDTFRDRTLLLPEIYA